MRAAIAGFLLCAPDHSSLHRWCRPPRLASLMASLQAFDAMLLKSDLPPGHGRSTCAQRLLDLAICRPVGERQDEAGAEHITGGKTSRLRPNAQFLALFITEFEQSLIISHIIKTLQVRCIIHWDGILGPVHTNRSASTMSAKHRKARNKTSSFSNREKMRRKPLSLRKSRSISLRFL